MIYKMQVLIKTYENQWKHDCFEKQIKKAHKNIYCFSFINLKNLAKKKLMKHEHLDSQS